MKVNIKKIKVMVIGSKKEIFKSKVNPSAKCGKRVMVNLVLCTKCSE